LLGGLAKTVEPSADIDPRSVAFGAETLVPLIAAPLGPFDVEILLRLIRPSTLPPSLQPALLSRD